MTSERELEALAASVGRYLEGDAEVGASPVYVFTTDELHELARRLQPARVPAYRERVSEIEDAVAAGTMNAYQCFTQMRQLVVAAAAPAAEGGMADGAASCADDDARLWAMFRALVDAGGPTTIARHGVQRGQDDWAQAVRGGMMVIERWRHPERFDWLGDQPKAAKPAPESREAERTNGNSHEPGTYWRDPRTGRLWSEVDVRFEGKNTIDWERVVVGGKPEAGQREGGSGNTLEWLGKTDAGVRLAWMLRDDVKVADFRSTLAEVIRLASAQQAGTGSRGEGDV